MQTSPLHPEFGVLIDGVDLNDVTHTHMWPEIRRAFDEHSALLFRNQDFSDETHVKIADLFGPKENREAMAKGKELPFSIPKVSNERDTTSGTTENLDLHTLNLQANMLWHTDSTFLPIPALVNILAARIVVDEGGETELVSTRAGWKTMPEHLKAQLQNATIWHRYSHSRWRINQELGNLAMFRQWPDRPWKSLWRNPVTGEDALYIASHSFAIEGLGLPEGQAIIDEAIAHCTQPERIYTHKWQVGDVLIFDERATMHRGRPWDYSKPRTLSSICCSVTDSDGFASVRVV